MVLTEVASIWGPIKIDFEKALGLSPDALHIHAGVLLLLIFVWAMRRPLHDWRPWLALFCVEFANEIIDMNQQAGSVESNWPASRHDLINTMVVPTLLLVYYRLRRRRQRSAMIRHAARVPAE